MNKKKSFIKMAGASFFILLFSTLFAIYLIQNLIVNDSALQLTQSLTEQLKRDIAIGDYRRAYETTIDKRYGNLKIVDFDIIENNTRVLLPNYSFQCDESSQKHIFICTKDANQKLYYFKLEGPEITKLFTTTEFKILSLSIILISILYNALLVSIFNSQLENFIAFFNKIIKREKINENELENLKNFKEKLLILEAQLESYDQTIEHKIKTQAQIELSKQLAHDIRSPLAAINSVIEDLPNTHKTILDNSIKRINEIAKRLLIETQDNLIKLCDNHSINPLIQDIIAEKLLEFKNTQVEIIFEEAEAVVGFCDPGEFKRILSNLLNNSIEASRNKAQIKISTKKDFQMTNIYIADNGTGIPAFILENLGKKTITTKKTGNGLGLSHAVSTLEHWGGKLTIESTGIEGTLLKISLRAIGTGLAQIKNAPHESSVILIDDDELTRTTWKMRAKKSGINFKTYSDILAFKADIESIERDTIIYIDSELGAEKGEDFARELHEMGFSNLSIASGHPPERFAQYTFLRTVISKKAPF